MFDFILSVIRTLGYPGLALLTLLENLFPPIPSEVIMPLAGFLTVRGQMNLVGVVIAGSIGSLLGAIGWYAVGRGIGEARLRRWVDAHGSWLTLSCDDLDRAQRWFDRHGAAAVLIGRLIPAIRSLISVPAGLTGMRPVPFVLYSAVGTLLWTAALVYAGRLLGSSYDQVGRYLDPVTWAILGGAVAWYLYRVVKLRRRKELAAAADSS